MADQTPVQRVLVGKLTQLLPCPFCGKNPEITSLGDGSPKYIRCGNPDCLVDCHTNSNLGPLHKQIEHWNTRAPMGGSQ